MDEQPYGELLTEQPLTADAWHGFLVRLVDRALAEDGEALRADSGWDDESKARLLEHLAVVPERPAKPLVHGDFFPSNVMVTDDLRVSGVLDFSPMTVLGDSQVDLAGSLMWLEVVPGYQPADSATLRHLIVERHGERIEPVIDLYRLVYSVYFAGARLDDPKLYDWCVANLRRWEGTHG
jgi:aminoglycoside phosphotransferase (APT) family kinase protein